MKTDKVSFGQTYLRPTFFRNISNNNKPKVLSLIGLGELYPTDIYIGGNRNGELIVDILHSTMGKYLYFSGLIPQTTLNTSIMQIMDSVEKITRKQNGYNLPVYNIKIKNLDAFTVPELQYTVHDKLMYYYDKILDKKFFH
jgi:hypothetical protein